MRNIFLAPYVDLGATRRINKNKFNMWCHLLGQLVNVVNICIEMSMSRLIENIQLACAVCKIGIYTVSAVLRGVAKTVGSTQVEISRI